MLDRGPAEQGEATRRAPAAVPAQAALAGAGAARDRDDRRVGQPQDEGHNGVRPRKDARRHRRPAAGSTGSTSSTCQWQRQ